MLTHKKLTEILSYNPDTGLFHFKVSRGMRKAGDEAGYTDKGYVRIAIDRKMYLAHRLAWFYTYGKWPDYNIDHINTVKDDNRIANLREDTGNWNTQNQHAAQKGNKLGVLGVYKEGNRFRARLKVNGKHVHVGYYATPEEAHEAYIKAKRELHPGCTI